MTHQKVNHAALHLHGHVPVALARQAEHLHSGGGIVGGPSRASIGHEVPGHVLPEEPLKRADCLPVERIATEKGHPELTGIRAEPEGISRVGRVAVIREIEPRRDSGVDRQVDKVRQVERCKTLSSAREISVREAPGTVGVGRNSLFR